LALWIALAVVPSCNASQTNSPSDNAALTSSSVPGSASDSAQQVEAENQSSDSDKPALAEIKTKRVRNIFVPFRHRSGDDRVSFGQDTKLETGHKADNVVSIFGSSTSDGEVSDAVVSLFGSSTSSNNVGKAVVSVCGNTRVTSGTVGNSAVAVLGNTYVNAHINQNVVAVLGNLELGPEAVVDGDIVCIGGELKRDPKAVVHGDVRNVAFTSPMNLEGLQTWFKECLLYARPLAFNSGVMWAWYIAFAFLAFYALLALVAPKGVIQCVRTLEEQPGYSILASVVIWALIPVVLFLLILSLALVVGFALLPIFALALFCSGVFGSVVMLAWIGRRITNLFGDTSLSHPFFAVMIGGVVLMGIYTVPILGFVAFKVLGLLGVGVVIYTLMLMFKNHKPQLATAAFEFAGGGAVIAPGQISDASISGVASAAVLSVSTLECAGFWRRIIASVLDFVMVAIVASLIMNMFKKESDGGVLMLWFAIYNIVLWATRSTTIGGVICGLKLVRLDGRKVDAGIAIVRGLSAFLSLFVFGLGFLWVVFNDHKQSWHDKIAGTTIVKVPKGTSLL